MQSTFILIVITGFCIGNYDGVTESLRKLVRVAAEDDSTTFAFSLPSIGGQACIATM
jgi:hypothetical protein